ncbi:MAG TPA: aconitate hydratase AcnA [Candidatus Megaira endosymbiont of Nemacystus decipiens]|nr:aconitate hydratase AcnA [Candidatus Megaera endosymbiont of Nemacystus decipiens]
MNKNSKYIKKIKIDDREYSIFDIYKAGVEHNFDVNKLPYCLKILLENTIRNHEDEKLVEHFKSWISFRKSKEEIGYMPARVLMQDFTGVPAIVDLASMRDAMLALGKDPIKINPAIPVDLVIDHSVQVDSFGNDGSFEVNVDKEFERNQERYTFLKWGQESFRNFRVVPPGTGICHQVNLEKLAHVVFTKNVDGKNFAYPDTLVGTDSHTTMINALSILGWGVGGIEAEAAMLGQPLPMILPEVIGFKLTGSMGENITATDLVLTVTQLLRKKKVVGKFVEFFGPGLASLSLSDRATISNMAPEYGATCGFFPIDDETLKYLKLTAREDSQIKLIEHYAQDQGIWYNSEQEALYTDVVELDMSTLEPSLAGPKRPQDRVKIPDLKENYEKGFPGYELGERNDTKLSNGSVVIAAITSCTNTSNPVVMIAAGLMAKKANEIGIKPKRWVKTSLAPGSKVVTEYLNKAGLTKHLDDLGFNLVGYGCTTCIGNSGPLDDNVEKTIKEQNLLVSSVLSGNRNFEGRIHPHVKANYLASPPLVVAYGLAGTINIDLSKDPLSHDKNNKPIYLKDIWPSKEEILEYVSSSITSDMFKQKYQDLFVGEPHWRDIKVTKENSYNWVNSTYIKNPPYFDNIKQPRKELSDIKNARILAMFGDSITTDHISPAGVISLGSPAANYLIGEGVEPKDFNSYGARRGNHEVMMRGTFANVRIKNLLCPGVEGGVTINSLNNEQMSIYDAAMDYKSNNIDLVIFAGKEYGTGSSRDWAAKGTSLLGIKVVIAESFERIHRSNLVGMGVLPIVLANNVTYSDLELSGKEKIDIIGITEQIKPYQPLQVIIKNGYDDNKIFDAVLQIYTDIEIDYIKNNGILENVIRNFKE